jgi:hypothetical protein
MFIPFGENCGPATALRSLKLRDFALPFDWVRSTPESLVRAVNDDFKSFHDDLRLSECKMYVSDSYGFQFPHDYPTQKDEVVSRNSKDEMAIEAILAEHWMEHIPAAKEKYARRIERFQSLMKSDKQLTILTTCKRKSIEVFRELFLRKYNKTNIVYVVLAEDDISDEEKERLLHEGVSVCDPETIWVDENDNWYIAPEEQNLLWKNAIVKILDSKKIELPLSLNSPPPT